MGGCLWGLAAVLLFVACKSSSSDAAHEETGVDAGKDASVGSVPDASAGTADAGADASIGRVTECADDGTACTKDDDCCAFLCELSGICGVPKNACKEDNTECVHDGECCSNVCSGDGYCGNPG